MWFTLDYALHENDPAYADNDDNYLYSIRRPLTQTRNLLDDLTFNSGLSPKDISRIGDISVDLIYAGKYSSDRLADTDPVCSGGILFRQNGSWCVDKRGGFNSEVQRRYDASVTVP